LGFARARTTQPTPDGLALLLDLISDPLVAAQLMYTGLDQRLLAFASEVRARVPDVAPF
jgi:hypothetical protein